MDFYCLHHTPSEDRKKYMDNLFFINDISPIWITSFLPDSKEVINHEKIYCEHSANNKYLNNAEISLYLKHQQAIELIEYKNQVGIIIEDDIKIPDFNLNNFCKDAYKDLIIKNGDILFIGSTTYDEITSNTNELIVHEPWMKSRCAHCYMINPKSASKILKFIKNKVAPFDWQLNYAIDNLNLKVFWSIKSVKQRSETKETQSLLR